jgi:hypothetical protein
LMSLEEMKYHTTVMEKMLKADDLKIYTGANVQSISQDLVNIKLKDGSSAKLITDFVVYSTGFNVPVSKIDGLVKSCKESYVIGDASQPKKIREAVHEADRIGRLI